MTSIDRPGTGKAGAAAAKGGNSQPYTVLEAESPEAWDALLYTHPLGNALQSSGWGLYKSRVGHHVKRLKVEDQKGTLVAMALVATKSKFGVRFFHILGGPLLFTESPTVAADAVKLLVTSLASGLRDVVLIEPKLFRSTTLTLALLSAGLTPIMRARDHTLVVDLTVPSEVLRASLRRQWRQSLRRAEDNPELTAEFRTTTESRDAALNTFARFYNDLMGRKGFRTNFDLAAAHSVLRDDDRYTILETREAGEPVAVHISFCSKDSMSGLFAASSERGHACCADYLAYWSEICLAKNEGRLTYDCSGIDPIGNPGSYRFKSGITKNVVQSGPMWVYAKRRSLQLLASVGLAVLR